MGPHRLAPTLWIALCWAAVAHAAPERLELASRAYEEAVAHLDSGLVEDARQAISGLEVALGGFREAGQPAAEAETLYALGIARGLLGETAAASVAYRAALAIQSRLGDPGGQAAALNNLGLIAAERGRPKVAFGHLEAALELRRVAADLAGEAATAHNLGALHVAVGELQAGLEHYRRALDLHRQLGDDASSAATLNNLGLVLVQLGQPERALDHHRRASELHRAAGSVRGQAGALANLGVAHFELERTAAAIGHLEAAARLYRAAGDRPGTADVLNNLGMVYSEAGQLEDASGHLEPALSAHRELGDVQGEAAVLHNLGQLHRRRQELEASRESLLRALELERRIEDLPGVGRSLLELAQTLRASGRLEAAVAAVTEAVSTVESLRHDVLHPTYRASWGGHWREFYELQVDLRMELDRERPGEGHAAAAWAAAERARARGLLDLLGEARRQILPPAAAEAEREMRRRLSLLERQRRRRVSLGDAAEAERLDAEIESLLDDYRRFEETLRADAPGYVEWARPPALDGAAVRRMLDAETVLLAYSLGEDRSYLWAVTRGEIVGWQLPPRERVEAAARRLHELLGRGRERALQGPAEVAAAELGALALEPAASRLGVRRVAVMADGALELVPFALLPVAGEPLGRRREVVSVPSASVLAAIRRRAGDGSPAGERPRLAILGDPVYEASDPRLAAVAGGSAALRPVSTLPAPAPTLPASAPLPRLDHSGLEAERIAALVPADRRLVARGLAARRELVTGGALAGFDVVHFAAHGLLDRRRPELSALALSRFDDLGRAVDGDLRLLDLYRLRLPADLVVLAACRTALGREVRSEGLIGLGRGFLYAGARRVLVSLWSVDDAATAALMERFYRGLLVEGLPPAAALREAQAEVASHPRWRAPYYWAAFVLVGDWL